MVVLRSGIAGLVGRRRSALMGGELLRSVLRRERGHPGLEAGRRAAANTRGDSLRGIKGWRRARPAQLKVFPSDTSSKSKPSTTQTVESVAMRTYTEEVFTPESMTRR